MILIIDAHNRTKHADILDDMFKLRARVFGGRLGWDVKIENGREIDEFDGLDPVYVIGLDNEDRVVACVRALQTTGPHMLADVFSNILQGEPPLRSATLWESTRFCVDTERLSIGDKGRNSVSYATCELMIGSLEFAMNSGIEDIITVIDPVMDRVLKRSDNAPYDYVGKTVQMGKTKALAALLDCTKERIERVRAFSGIEGDIFVDEDALAARMERRKILASEVTKPTQQRSANVTQDDLILYCREQIESASTVDERQAAIKLSRLLLGPNINVAFAPVSRRELHVEQSVDRT